VLQRLRREILLKQYEPGERLPPERQLASRLGTNRNTLREALRTLEADNLVRSRQGDGTIVLDWRTIGEIPLLPEFLIEDTPALERIDVVTTLLELRSMLLDRILTLSVERGDEDDWGLVFDAFEDLRAHREGIAAVVADVRLFRCITLSTHNLVLIWVFNTFSKIFLELGRRFPALWDIDDEYLKAMDDVIHDLREGRGDRARHRVHRLLEERSVQVARQLRTLAAHSALTPAPSPSPSPPIERPRPASRSQARAATRAPSRRTRARSRR